MRKVSHFVRSVSNWETETELFGGSCVNQPVVQSAVIIVFFSELFEIKRDPSAGQYPSQGNTRDNFFAFYRRRYHLMFMVSFKLLSN